MSPDNSISDIYEVYNKMVIKPNEKFRFTYNLENIAKKDENTPKNFIHENVESRTITFDIKESFMVYPYDHKKFRIKFIDNKFIYQEPNDLYPKYIVTIEKQENGGGENANRAEEKSIQKRKQEDITENPFVAIAIVLVVKKLFYYNIKNKIITWAK